MENKITIFENNEFGRVRTLEINNEPWFVGRDVAEILGYAKPRNAIATHVDEDDALKQGIMDNLGRNQETVLINESGLYSLILSSKLPSAKSFKKWITLEVLPSIRKTGSYSIIPKDYPSALRALADEYEKNQKLLAENTVMKPKADYFDALVDKNCLMNFRDTAKELRQKQKQFIDWLLDNKFVYRDEQ